MMRTRGPRKAAPPLRHYSSSVLRTLARTTRFMDPALADRWTEIVGEEIASLCWPGRLSPGSSARSLEVMTRSGAEATRLALFQDDIITRVNRVLGPGTVARLTIRQSAQRNAAPVHPAMRQTGSAGKGSALEGVLSRFHQKHPPAK